MKKLRKYNAGIKTEEEYAREEYKYNEKNYRLGWVAKFFVLSGMHDVSFHMKYFKPARLSFHFPIITPVEYIAWT